MKHEEVLSISNYDEITLAEVVRRIKAHFKFEKLDLSRVVIKLETEYRGYRMDESSHTVANIYYINAEESVIV